VPLCKACALLERPPILSYDGYAPYNWKRIDATGPIALGHIDTLRTVYLHGTLVHSRAREIEAIGARPRWMDRGLGLSNPAAAGVTLLRSADTAAHWHVVAVLWWIPVADPAPY
jgi:indoleamine 2,3-dioxygenase